MAGAFEASRSLRRSGPNDTAPSSQHLRAIETHLERHITVFVQWGVRDDTGTRFRDIFHHAVSDRVIFVDATKEPTTDGFYLRPCSKVGVTEMNSHSLHPETVYSLCSAIYKKEPECLILGIEGQDWGLETGLSPEAESNLERAKRYFIAHLFVYL